jgi:hypothetical protein
MNHGTANLLAAGYFRRLGGGNNTMNSWLIRSSQEAIHHNIHSTALT